MIRACSGASGSPLGAGMRWTRVSSSSATPSPVLALTRAASVASMPMISSISLADLVRVGRGQIDLVDDRHDLEPLLDRGVAVGDALRLDALRGIHHQQRAVARGERARHFVGEVHVAGGVDHVELVALAVVGVVVSVTLCALMVMPRSRSSSMESSTWACISRSCEAAAELDEAVGQCGLAVIDVGDDREIAYVSDFFYEFFVTHSQKVPSCTSACTEKARLANKPT